MDIQAIQVGLAAAAKGVTGIHQSVPALLDAIDPPTFACTEFEGDFNQAFGVGDGAMAVPTLTCAVFASRADDAAGRALINGFIRTAGPTSIKAAIEADRTLGGACKTLNVDRWRGAYRLYAIGGYDYLGVLFDIRVWG